MHYIALLVLWLPVAPDKPPVASFLAHYDTLAECQDKIEQVKLEPKVKDQLSCMLMVVDPKRGIKE